MYNETFIKEFNESDYLKTLSTMENMEAVRNIARDQYTDKSNAFYLAYKESLDHYVLKRLMTDPKFIDSPEFRNYICYALSVSNDKSLRATDQYRVYPELITNPVFRNDEIRRQIFEKHLNQKQREGYERHRAYSKKIVDYVFEEMKQNHRLTPDLINIAADYIY